MRRDGLAAGRAPGRAVPDLARDPGDVPAARHRGHGGRDGGRAGARSGRVPGMRCRRSGSPRGVTVVLLAYPAWFGVAGPQAVTGVLFPLAPVLGGPALRPALARPVPGVRQRVRPLRGLPGAQRPPGRLRRRWRGAGRGWRPWWRPGGARSPGCSLFMTAVTLWLALGAYLEQRAQLARPPLAALERALAAARPQGDPAGPVRAARHPLHRLPARSRPRRALRGTPTADLVGGASCARRHRGGHRGGGRAWRSCRSS